MFYIDIDMMIFKLYKMYFISPHTNPIPLNLLITENFPHFDAACSKSTYDL